MALAFLIFMTAWLSATTLQEVLGKHIRALGGREAVGSIQSTVSFTYEICYRKGYGQYCEGLMQDNLLRFRGIDRGIYWNVNKEGLPIIGDSAAKASILGDMFFDTYAYLTADSLVGRIHYIGDTSLSDTLCHILSLCPAGGDSSRLLINVKSGLPVLRMTPIGKKCTIVYYDTYRTFQNVVLPTLTRTEHIVGDTLIKTKKFLKILTNDGKIIAAAPNEVPRIPNAYVMVKIDSVQVNADIPDSIFAMPVVVPPDVTFPAGLDSVAVPCKFKNEHLFVDVMINGKGPFTMMLDTGCDPNYISKKTAKKLGIAATLDKKTISIGGFGKAGEARIDSIAINGIVMRSPEVMVSDDDFDGMLGYGFFERLAVRVDLRKHQVIIYNPALMDLHAQGIRIPLELYNGLSIIHAFIDGRNTRLELDLGSFAEITIQRRARVLTALIDRARDSSQEGAIMGSGGISTVKIFTAGIFKSGDWVVAKPKIQILDNYEGMPMEDYIDGSVGMGILKRYDILIDYRYRRLYLQPLN